MVPCNAQCFIYFFGNFDQSLIAVLFQNLIATHTRTGPRIPAWGSQPRTGRVSGSLRSPIWIESFPGFGSRYFFSIRRLIDGIGPINNVPTDAVARQPAGAWGPDGLQNGQFFLTRSVPARSVAWALRSSNASTKSRSVTATSTCRSPWIHTKMISGPPARWAQHRYESS